MRDVRKGNDLSLIWSLNIKGTGEPFDLSGLSLKLYLKDVFGRKEVEDFTVQGNRILWTFYGKDQKHTGKHSLELVVNEGEVGMITVDACDFVNLVSCSCKAGGTDGCGVNTETLELETQISLGAASLEVDEELSETSQNPVSNATLTKKFAELLDACCPPDFGDDFNNDFTIDFSYENTRN